MNISKRLRPGISDLVDLEGSCDLIIQQLVRPYLTSVAGAVERHRDEG